MSKRALVVEDDVNIAELLRLYLGKDGFDVMIAPDGGKAGSMFDLFQPDVVLLDIMLPVKDGWQVCREIRKKSSTPIIMLTAKGETADKINGLDMGADDYVTKPFDVKELLARIHAVMRRTDADAPVEKKLSYDKLIINLESYELIVDGKKVDTPPKEMELLYHLAAPGPVCCWGWGRFSLTVRESTPAGGCGLRWASAPTGALPTGTPCSVWKSGQKGPTWIDRKSCPRWKTVSVWKSSMPCNLNSKGEAA